MASAAAHAAEDSDPVGGYVLERHIGFLLRRAHQRHAATFNELIGKADLTPMQFAALVKAVQLGRVTQNHLGRLTAMDPATIQGVVRRLIERGLLSRDADPMDRRSAVLAPTQAAGPVVQQALEAIAAISERTLATLSATERAELVRLLNKLA